MATIITIKGTMTNEARGTYWGELATPDDGTKSPKVAELQVVDNTTWPRKMGKLYSLRIGPRGGLRLVEIK